MANKKDKTKYCELCEGSFQYKRRDQRFCSALCANEASRRRGRKQVLCLECEAAFEVINSEERKFCSHSCSASYSNKRRANTKCALPECDKNSNDRRKEYCSMKHRQQHLLEKWLAGEESGSTTYDVKAFVRRYVLERSMGQCEAIDARTGERCAENRTNSGGTTILQLDHIDGNWQNNTPENLRMICPSCHVLTENWGARNMGNGRTWKKDYNQYKSKNLAT